LHKRSTLDIRSNDMIYLVVMLAARITRLLSSAEVVHLVDL
jgi:hypothetical protein